MYLGCVRKKYVNVWNKFRNIEKFKFPVCGRVKWSRPGVTWDCLFELINHHRDIIWQSKRSCRSWWRHQMRTFSALREFPAQRPVTRSIDVYCMFKTNNGYAIVDNHGQGFVILISRNGLHLIQELAVFFLTVKQVRIWHVQFFWTWHDLENHTRSQQVNSFSWHQLFLICQFSISQ